MGDAGGSDERGRPVGEMFRQLLDDGRAYAQAEFDLAKARVEIKVVEYRGAVILAAIAIFLAFAATVTLCLSLVLWLSHLAGPYVGGALATLIVGAAAVIVAILAKKAFDRAAD